MQDSLAMRPVSAVAPEVPVDGMAAPDLLGKSMATVVRKAREAGVELIIGERGVLCGNNPHPVVLYPGLAK